jgi:hypothetical protein
MNQGPVFFLLLCIYYIFARFFFLIPICFALFNERKGYFQSKVSEMIPPSGILMKYNLAAGVGCFG